MILADKIVNERKRCGWSQEELAEKLGVSRQSVSKWESAQSVPELSKILQMAEAFQVSLDYLLKDELEPTAPSRDMTEYRGGSLARVSMEEANAFMDFERRRAPKLANAVSLCILSPVVLISLSGFTESGPIRIGENAAVGIGVMVMLLMVACAVWVFMRLSHRAEHFEWLREKSFETAYGVDGLVRERREAFAERYSALNSLGVILCILCILPLIGTAVMGLPAWIIVQMVSLMLLIVAVAVNLFIRVGTVKESYDVLLREKDYSDEAKAQNERLAPIGGVYWMLACAVYLAISFLTGAWKKSWIVWPVAGVAFGAVRAIARAIEEKRNG